MKLQQVTRTLWVKHTKHLDPRDARFSDAMDMAIIIYDGIGQAIYRTGHQTEYQLNTELLK